jgi:type I restriction enzyme R subunit
MRAADASPKDGVAQVGFALASAKLERYDEAVIAMRMHYERCCDFFHGFNWSKWTSGKPAQKLSLLPAAQEHLLAKAAKEKKPEEHKQKFMQAVTDLSKAFALAVPQPEAIEIRDNVGFFQAVRAVLAKGDGQGRKYDDDMDHAIRQIISRAVASDEVVDIFAAAGCETGHLNFHEFLAEVRGAAEEPCRRNAAQTAE